MSGLKIAKDDSEDKKDIELWYRVKEQRYASCYEEDSRGSTLRIEVLTFRVDKKTPKGVWLTTNLNPDVSEIYQERFWVNRNSRKRYACPSIEAAYQSFFIRKERQISILRSRLNQAEEALELGKIQAEKKGL